jgi:hypothetical protein
VKLTLPLLGADLDELWRVEFVLYDPREKMQLLWF